LAAVFNTFAGSGEALVASTFLSRASRALSAFRIPSSAAVALRNQLVQWTLALFPPNGSRPGAASYGVVLLIAPRTRRTQQARALFCQTEDRQNGPSLSQFYDRQSRYAAAQRRDIATDFNTILKNADKRKELFSRQKLSDLTKNSPKVDERSSF